MFLYNHYILILNIMKIIIQNRPGMGNNSHEIRANRP